MTKSKLSMPTTHISSITLGTCIKTLSIVGLIAGVAFYVQFQARNLLTGPTIHLNETQETVHHTRTLQLTGNAQNIVKLTLNGKEIHTNGNGEFMETLILEKGYTITTLEAKDRFGRTKTLTQAYVYVPETTEEYGV